MNPAKVTSMKEIAAQFREILKTKKADEVLGIFDMAMTSTHPTTIMPTQSHL